MVQGHSGEADANWHVQPPNRSYNVASITAQICVARQILNIDEASASLSFFGMAPRSGVILRSFCGNLVKRLDIAGVVIDLFSRMVVGWSMDKRTQAKLVCDALRMALWRRRMPRDVVVHSDRGGQYCSRRYQALLIKHGLVCTMSGKGNCYYNACAESFFPHAQGGDG